MKSKNGFTLVELLVAVVIVGILAGIAVPKMFGHTAKAKASEVVPAGMAYIRLQHAYTLARGGIGSWQRIGYQAPGNGKTDNFQYTSGFSASIKPKNVAKAFAGEGRIGWQAENIVGLDECHLGNKWIVTILAEEDGYVKYSAKVVPSETSPHCIVLTGDLGKLNIRPAKNQTTAKPETPADPVVSEPSDPIVPEVVESSSSEAEVDPNVDPEMPDYTNVADCMKNNGFLHGAKMGSACKQVRENLEREGLLVCTSHAGNGACNQYQFEDGAECVLFDRNCKEPAGDDANQGGSNANGTFSGSSEADAKAHFGNVPVLCADGGSKYGCSEWRKASDCPDKNWTHSGKCNSWK